MISMRQHFVYAMILTQSVAFTQIKHIVIENLYSSMEPENIFYYWWLCYVVSDIGKLYKVNSFNLSLKFNDEKYKTLTYYKHTKENDF